MGANMTVGSLNVKLDMELNSLQAQINKANAKIARMGKSWHSEIGKAAKKINDDMGKVGMKLGIGFLGAENALSLVNREIRHVIENIDEIPGIDPSTVSSIQQAKALFSDARGEIDKWIASGISLFAEVGQGLGYLAGAAVYGWDAASDAYAETEQAAQNSAEAAKEAAKRQKELEEAAKAAEEAARKTAEAYAKMLDAYQQEDLVGESLGVKIDRLKEESAKLQKAAVEAGRTDSAEAFRLEAEATKKRIELKQAERELNERMLEIGERQTQAEFDKLTPSEQLNALIEERARVVAEIAQYDGRTAAGLEKAVNLEERRLDLNEKIADVKVEVMDKELDEFFGSIDKKSAEANEKIAGSAKSAQDAARQLGMTFSSAFEDAIVDGKKLSDVLGGLADDLLRLALRKNITEPLFASLFSSEKSGGGEGGILGAIGGLFGGFFADGGRPPVGRPSVVGEDGAELFVPDSAGTIVSNDRLREAIGGGGGGFSVSIVQKFEAGVSQAQLAEGLSQTYEAAKSGVMDAIQRRRGGFGALSAA